MVDRIRTLLQFRGHTTTQFADAIGVARPIVSHILSGRNKPSLEVVQRILAAFPEVSMGWLLNGAGPMLVAGPAAEPAAPIAPVPPAPPLPKAQPMPEAAPLPAGATASPPPAPLPYSAPVAPTADSNKALPVNAVNASSGRGGAPQPPRFVAKESEEAAAYGRRAPEPPAPVPAAPVPAAPAPAPSPATALAGEATAPLPAVAALPPPTPASALGARATEPGAALAAALSAEPHKSIRRIVIFYNDGSFADYRPE